MLTPVDITKLKTLMTSKGYQMSSGDSWTSNDQKEYNVFARLELNLRLSQISYSLAVAPKALQDMMDAQPPAEGGDGEGDGTDGADEGQATQSVQAAQYSPSPETDGSENQGEDAADVTDSTDSSEATDTEGVDQTDSESTN